jgi:hypothetical protein
MVRFLIAGLAIAGLLSMAACAPVEPWERGILAKPYMALNPSPVNSAMRSHTYISREAASGGDTAEGGGCGCN